MPELLSIPATGYGIVHMEKDRFVNGNILYIESHAVKTINLSTNESWLIAGNATDRGYRNGKGNFVRFHAPFSFHQRSSTEVIIFDSMNSCIRILSRLTNLTMPLAGLCITPGNKDGNFTTTRFSQPEKNVEISSNAIAITDVKNNCIMMLDFALEQITTLVQLALPLVGITMKPDSEDLIFSYSGGLGKVNFRTLEVEYTTETNYVGYRDGTLDAAPRTGAIFSLKPEELLFLSNKVMMVADLYNHMLRIVDYENFLVSSVCDPAFNGSLSHIRAGNITSCRLSYPRSLLHMPGTNRILIGFHQSLGYIEVSSSPTTPTAKMTSTSKVQPTPQSVGLPVKSSVTTAHPVQLECE